MKRFTDTAKWRNPWFRRLSPTAKHLRSYAWDNCDLVGGFEFDPEAFKFDVGCSVTEKHMEELASEIQPVGGSKYYIRTFIGFQYGELKESCPPHRPILKALLTQGIVRDSIGYYYPNARVSITLQEKEKEKDQEKDLGVGMQGERVFKTPELLRIEALFGRKLITEPSDGEVKAYKKIGVIDPDDLSLIERYYRAEIKDQDYRRRDLQTLLNNWKGEVDRARNFKFPAESNGGF